MTDLNLSMFKAYDIRTPADRLSLELSERLALAEVAYFSEVLQARRVVMARDARLSGPQYLQQGIEIFRDKGFEVLTCPQVSSTCLFYYTCMRHPDAAGILYGASHNPPGDTGQKIVGPGLVPIAEGCGPGGGLTEIRRLYQSGFVPQSRGRGDIVLLNPLQEFVRDSLQWAGIRPGELQGCRILGDFLSGAAGQEFILAMSDAGADFSPYHFIPDGRFPQGAPNPVIPASIASSVARLKSGGFHFGMLFDGDGDRMDFFSPEGLQLSPCFNFGLIVPGIREAYAEVFSSQTYAPQLFVDLKANPLAIVRIAQQGFGVHVIRNGHSQIKESLRRHWPEQFLAAVEESSHYYLNILRDGSVFPSENTLFYGLLTVKNWWSHPAQYREALELQSTTFREREWGYKFPDDNARSQALHTVEQTLLSRGARAMARTADGMDMEATLIRGGLPFVIQADTQFPSEWVQVSQRISQSEKGLARWEVTAGTRERMEEAVSLIDKTAHHFGAGDRYVG